MNRLNDDVLMAVSAPDEWRLTCGIRYARSASVNEAQDLPYFIGTSTILGIRVKML